MHSEGDAVCIADAQSTNANDANRLIRTEQSQLDVIRLIRIERADESLLQDRVIIEMNEREKFRVSSRGLARL
jgi:hypothetical protein